MDLQLRGRNMKGIQISKVATVSAVPLLYYDCIVPGSD
jgi:hypothetical protein